MPHELISKKTRSEFREFLVGWVLREIVDVFEAADIECRTEYQPPVGGQRRSLVEQYYASLDSSDQRDVKKLLKAYEYILTEAFAPKTNYLTGASTSPSDAAKKLVSWLRKDGYDFVHERLVPISGISGVTVVRATAHELDAPHLGETIRRIEGAVDADPALAIGSAKELVETCCNTILAERGVTEDLEKLDLGPLVKRTARELKLVPESVPDSAKGAESIRRVLSNLASLTQGLAEIRNLYGTGHGKDGKRRGLGPRHARLAVGAATTLVTFLLDTHREREADS